MTNMKKTIILILAALMPLAVMAKKEKKQEVDSLGNKIKTGWNFGILPSVAYDADYGFQGGILTNVYYYGDGSQYPEYIHSIYFEGAYTTKHHGIFRLNYDSKYLIPGYRLTLDATYLPDAMCERCAISTALTAIRRSTTTIGITGIRSRRR